MDEMHCIAFFFGCWVAGCYFILFAFDSELTPGFASVAILGPWMLVYSYFLPSQFDEPMTWLTPVAGTIMGLLSALCLYITTKRPLK